MMEDQRGLFIAFRLPKIVAHYEDDVNVIWVWLSGDITAKDNEAFEFAGAASEVINAQQPRGHKLALGSSVPKTSDHFVERSLMDAGRQVSMTIELGKRHSCAVRLWPGLWERGNGWPAFFPVCVGVSR